MTNLEQETILSWVRSGASVLDLGCGDGELLARLAAEKGVRAQGIELNGEAISNCVAAGLSVFQQDIDTGLTEFGDRTFDYVVLNQTFQQVRKPGFALKEALRVGKQVIVGFPNFCHIRSRLQILLRGRVPVTTSLPYEWYDTPNLHFLSIANFTDYCRKRGVRVEGWAFTAGDRRVKILPNLFAETGLFLLSKTSHRDVNCATR
jgi:methionine biosynthesis protein MetW